MFIRLGILIAVIGLPAITQPTAMRPAGASRAAETIAGVPLPTGFSITPLAAPGASLLPLRPGVAGFADYVAGQPVSMALSPDGNMLVVLTSGYNLVTGSNGQQAAAASTDFVFAYDVTANQLTYKQALPVAGAFAGVAWNPKGDEFYIAGAVKDTVYIFTAKSGSFVANGSIPLWHKDPFGFGSGLGLGIQAIAAGVACNARGDRLVVTNYANDSVSLIDIAGRTVLAELDLRPGVVDEALTGVAGGEYPFWVVIKGNDKAYVSSVRDREIVAVGLAGDKPTVTGRIALRGNPNKMILNAAQTLLFAAVDNSDTVAVIDTGTEALVEQINTTAPTPAGIASAVFMKGSNPNSLALSPNERVLYVTNGGTNSVAVIALGSPSQTIGLIPTGWYPQAVSVSADGSTLLVAHSKNVPGPNPGGGNQYILQLQKGGMQTIPVPNRRILATLTAQVEANNNFNPPDEHGANRDVMVALREKIKHVIYIVKENRTYDQVLGDLEKGNGDPKLAMFGEQHTPNQHLIARKFVTLDNFYDSGEVSGVGWNWSTAGRATDSVEKTIPAQYAGRLGPAFEDYEGTNRNINMGYAKAEDRVKVNPVSPLDPNQLPGTADVNAPDSSEGEAGAGYLWDAALRSGLSVRNYGFYLDLTRYNLPALIPLNIPASPSPFADGIVQAYAAKASLQPVTDPYFRGFDLEYPDYYRYQEWAREFDLHVKNGNLPSLSLVRFMHDHTGSFATAKYGVNTAESQVADNDYAVGLLLEHLAASPYKNDTLVFVIEDDAQAGPDHVDAHRSTAFIAGPYVKQGALVSTRYTTVSMMRTMKDVLGIPYFGLNDGTAEPMADVFDLAQEKWDYTSLVPAILRSTKLPVPARTAANSLPDSREYRAALRPRHDAKWWAKRSEGQNFAKEDDLDEVSYNEVLWKGTMGRMPYPKIRDGRDLRQNREVLLKRLR